MDINSIHVDTAGPAHILFWFILLIEESFWSLVRYSGDLREYLCLIAKYLAQSQTLLLF
jgi:hypothetical protein